MICDVWQSVETLTELFAAGGVKTQVVFVSACHSEMVGRAFIDAGVREYHIPKHSLCMDMWHVDARGPVPPVYA